MSAMDKDLAATLTPEELEAINSTEDNPPVNEEDKAALKALADQHVDDDKDDNDDDDKGDPNAAPVEGKPDAKDKAGTNEATKTGDDKAKQEEAIEPAAQETATKRETFVPRYKAELPANYNETLVKLSADEAALKQRFKDGEIEFDEFEEARAVIFEERSRLEKSAWKAEISQEMNAQTAEQQWESTVNGYLNSVKTEIDYLKDVEKAADFDQFVKVLAANPANQDKSMEWFLQEGHRRVKVLHGIESAPVKDDKQDTTTQKDDKAGKPNPRKPPLDAAPKNLSQVPGSDGPGDVQDEFSDIDRLEGEAFEAALAKLTPAQRERYLQA
ncbi:hypothetical protein [Limnobacter sp. P1]|uniref:hypothetical protein n=1 Tax=Limnobacter olei TaxID=3031298 RepID=UPI0023B04548|nr:hypothetical protein [Limnobacter sp. P1]